MALPSTRSANGLLVVIPPEPGGVGPVPPTTLVAGLPLLRRIVLAGARAGFRRVLAQGLAADGDALATPADVLAPAGQFPSRWRGRIVVLPTNVVPTPRWLRSLLETLLEKDTLYVDAAMVAVVESDDPRPILAAAARCRSATELVAALRGMFGTVARSFDPAGRFPLGASRDVPKAEAWLRRSLIKRSEGVTSRYV